MLTAQQNIAPRSRSNIIRMKRFVLSLLLAWVAVAPVLANACAVRCEMRSDAMQQQHQDAASDMDCHGSDGNKEGSGSSDHLGGFMAAGCLLAAAASAPTPAIVLWNAESAAEHPDSLFLVPPSVTSAPPDKPPRA